MSPRSTGPRAMGFSITSEGMRWWRRSDGVLIGHALLEAQVLNGEHAILLLHFERIQRTWRRPVLNLAIEPEGGAVTRALELVVLGLVVHRAAQVRTHRAIRQQLTLMPDDPGRADLDLLDAVPRIHLVREQIDLDRLPFLEAVGAPSGDVPAAARRRILAQWVREVRDGRTCSDRSNASSKTVNPQLQKQATTLVVNRLALV